MVSTMSNDVQGVPVFFSYFYRERLEHFVRNII